MAGAGKWRREPWPPSALWAALLQEHCQYHEVYSGLLDNDGCELLNTYHKIKRQAAFAIQLQKTTRMKYYSSQITTACDWQQPDQERNKNLVTEPLQEKGGNKTETKGEAEQTTVAKSKNFREKIHQQRTEKIWGMQKKPHRLMEAFKTPQFWHSSYSSGLLLRRKKVKPSQKLLFNLWTRHPPKESILITALKETKKEPFSPQRPSPKQQKIKKFSGRILKTIKFVLTVNVLIFELCALPFLFYFPNLVLRCLLCCVGSLSWLCVYTRCWQWDSDVSYTISFIIRGRENSLLLRDVEFSTINSPHINKIIRSASIFCIRKLHLHTVK